jgi:hypothetical protein
MTTCVVGLGISGCQDPSAQLQTQAREDRIAEILGRIEAKEAERPALLRAAGVWIEKQYQGDIEQTHANQQRIRDMNAQAEANWAERAPQHRRFWEKQWAGNPQGARKTAIDMLY